MRIFASTDLSAPGAIGGTTPGVITGTTITATEKFLAADGLQTAPSYSFTGDTNTGLFRLGSDWMSFTVAGVAKMAIRAQTDEVQLAPTTALGWASAIGASVDLKFNRDAANILAQRNGTTAQESRLYSTYTDASNYERLALKTTAGSKVTVAAETAGTGGDNLDLELLPAGTGMVQFSNAQDAAAAGAGTLSNAPIAGNPAKWLKVKIGATAYAIPAWALA